MNTNGFQTKVWGPAAWLFLHTIARNYDPDKPGMKDGYLLFFRNLEHVLPCGKCRENYAKIINSENKKLRLDKSKLKTREMFSYWLFLVHNKVQTDIYEKTLSKNDKPKYTNTTQDFKKSKVFYEKFRAKCDKTSYGCTKSLRGKKMKSILHICDYDSNRFVSHKSIRVNKKCE